MAVKGGDEFDVICKEEAVATYYYYPNYSFIVLSTFDIFSTVVF